MVPGVRGPVPESTRPRPRVPSPLADRRVSLPASNSPSWNGAGGGI